MKKIQPQKFEPDYKKICDGIYDNVVNKVHDQCLTIPHHGTIGLSQLWEEVKP